MCCMISIPWNTPLTIYERCATISAMFMTSLHRSLKYSKCLNLQRMLKSALTVKPICKPARSKWDSYLILSLNFYKACVPFCLTFCAGLRWRVRLAQLVRFLPSSHVQGPQFDRQLCQDLNICATLFYLTYSAFHPSRVGRWVPASGGSWPAMD